MVVGRNRKLIAGTGKDEAHLIVLATGDRGLAGAFNTNIVRAARRRRRVGGAGKGAVHRCAGPSGDQRIYPKGIITSTTPAR